MDKLSRGDSNIRMGKFFLSLVFLSSLAAAKNQPPKPKVLLSEELTLAAKVFRQADAVIREMWWVVAADRKVPQKTPFGKMSRAVQQDLGHKLSKTLGFRCDRYRLKKEGSKRPLKVEIFEACSVKNSALIAEFKLEKENRMSVTIYPEHLVEVLGLQASVVNKRASCDLSFQDNGILNSLHCRNWTQDRSAKELVDLSKLEYRTSETAIMEISGEILTAMNPIKKIETTVPLSGPITVTETEIPQPVQAVPPPPPVPPPTAEPGKVQAPPKKQPPLPEAEYLPAEQPNPEEPQAKKPKGPPPRLRRQEPPQEENEVQEEEDPDSAENSEQSEDTPPQEDDSGQYSR